jgi:lysophospholipase L1-like esterase
VYKCSSFFFSNIFTPPSIKMVSFKHLSLAALASGALAQNATLRYMPFGDSITEIICWRGLLWEKLQATEWKSVDFVGSGKTENNCGDNKYDRDNEGHSGFLAIDIANKNQLDGWLNKNPADVITMHLGTNDIVQQNKAVTDIIAAFTKLVGTMRTKNPKVKIIVRPLPSISHTNHSPLHRSPKSSL